MGRTCNELAAPWDPNSATFSVDQWERDYQTYNALIETMRHAYADRARLMGDPDFVKVPVGGMLSKRYAASLRAKIDREHATPSDKIRAAAHIERKARTLIFTQPEMAAFIAGAKNGDFDHLLD